MQHFFIILGYVLLSMAMGVALPTFVTTVSLGEGLIAGLMVTVIAGLVHENIHRRKISSMQARHLLLLKKAYDKTKLEILDLRNDVMALNAEAGFESAPLGDAEEAAPATASAKPLKASSPRKVAKTSKGDLEAVPSFLTEEEAEETHESDASEEGEKEVHWLDQIDAEEAAEAAAAAGHEGEDYHEDAYEDEYDDEGYEEYEEDDYEMSPQETEIERRQALAQEVEVLQKLVDKLYSEGLPQQVRDRIGDEADDGDAYEDGTPRIKPHVDIEEAMLPIVREALDAKRLDAHLQPIHTLPQRKRRFFEAFGRLRSKDGELLIPERIQVLMDEDGLNPAADTLLLYRCAQILKQNGGLEFDRAIFCNVSPATLSDVSFLRDFSEYMEKRRTLARSLVLEVDYEAIDPMLDDLREPMGRLAGIGLRFALDHVKATDLDAMALGRSHISYVKLDSPAVLAMIKRQGDNRFQAMRRNLEKENIEIIADQIASERMLMDVMDLGIEYGQGILFGEPKPVKDPSSGLRIV